MADHATQDPTAQSGQSSLQTSSATASAQHLATPTSFHRFASLPDELRRRIWRHAYFPTRIHFLEFPKSCTLPRVGFLEDPADAPDYPYPGVHDDLAMLIANSENYRQQWSVPGCRKFRNFYWRRDLNKLRDVCLEAKDAYTRLVNNERGRLTLKKGVHVNEEFDIFHFSCPFPNLCCATWLLTMRPRLCPTNLAIEVKVGHNGFHPDYNFNLIHENTEAQYNGNYWLLKAIEWGQDAKEGYKNSPQSTLAPSIDNIMIDLQDLQAVFLIDSAIRLRQHNRSNPLPSACQYNVLAHGMESYFYGISPGNEEIMRNWDVPAYLWPVLEETKKVFKP